MLILPSLGLASLAMVHERERLDEDETAKAPARTRGDLTPQERLEASSGGRWLLRAFLALTVLTVVVWNFPSSGIKSRASPVVERYINATGLSQTWNLFAPDPTNYTSELVARIEYSDGTWVRWQPPRGGAVVGEYRDYHWSVFADRLGYPDLRPLREPFARWLARVHSQGERRPVRVELISRRRDNLPPGDEGPIPAWEETTLFTLNLLSGHQR